MAGRDNGSHGPSALADKASSCYRAQFDANVVRVLSANRQLNETSWLPYTGGAPAVYNPSPGGMNAFLNQTQCGVATRGGPVCLGDVDQFNSHDIVSGYFQEGNALSSFVENLYDYTQLPTLLHPLSESAYKAAKASIELLNSSWAGRDVRLSAVALFNDQPYHTPGIALAAVDTALLMLFTGNKDISFRVTNHPTKATSQDQIAAFFNEQVESFDIAFGVALSMAFLSATFSLLAIRERVTKSKHLQAVSGASPVTFWATAYIWDFVNLTLPTLGIVLCLLAYQVQGFQGSHMMFVLLVLILFGLAVLPMTYCLSFLFPTPSAGFVKIVIYNILLGPGMMAATGVLSIPQLHLVTVRDIIVPIFMILSPHYALGHSLRIYHDNYLAAKTCEPIVSSGICDQENVHNACCPSCGGNQICLKYSANYFTFTDPPGVGLPLLLLFFQALLYTGFLLLKELGYVERFLAAAATRRDFGQAEEAHDVPPDTASPPQIPGLPLEPSRSELDRRSSTWSQRSLVTQRTENSGDELGDAKASQAWADQHYIDDVDVSREQTKVESRTKEELIADGAVVIMDHIGKEYGGGFRAVKSLSLCVEKGECFGLLGINGAGKTTTFKMITGDEAITDGDAFIDGLSVKSQPVEAVSRLGYCPQFDALTDQMTIEETLKLYGALRGLPPADIARLSDQLISSLALTNHRRKMAGTLSGGNKRKLSVAIALLGNPPVVLLDEPTAGVDPIARRRMWKVLSAVRAQGLSLILTSHGMEECEALCTRLAIMVDGRFKCLGSPQHLKAKFGTGYTVLLKVSKARKVPKAVQTLMELFPGTTLKDIHQRLIHVHIGNDTVRWAEIFGQMERVKGQLAIVDYSVTQTSLEQIFLNFSRQQTQAPAD